MINKDTPAAQTADAWKCVFRENGTQKGGRQRMRRGYEIAIYGLMVASFFSLRRRSKWATVF